MADIFIFLNGEIIPEHSAHFPLPDLGLYRGYSVFDYLRTHKGQPFALSLYLKRFMASAAAFRLKLTYTEDELSQIISLLLQKNLHLGEQGVRLLLTGGISDDVFTSTRSSLLIRTEASRLPKPDLYTTGAPLITWPYRREFATVKHTNYVQVLLAWPEAERVGAQEILYHDDGEVLECSRSNFFIVKGNTLITPPTDRVLKGVTRHILLKTAAAIGMQVEERAVKLEEIAQASEALITSTTKAIMPITKIDDSLIGPGQVGPWSKKIMTAWSQFLNKEKYLLELT